MLAATTLPPLVLLEDYRDVCDFLEYSGRTVPRHKWAAESIRAAADLAREELF